MSLVLWLRDTGYHSAGHSVAMQGHVLSVRTLSIKTLLEKLWEKPTSGYIPTLLSSNPVANGFNPLYAICLSGPVAPMPKRADDG
jgi:hypothetical protein